MEGMFGNEYKEIDFFSGLSEEPQTSNDWTIQVLENSPFGEGPSSDLLSEAHSDVVNELPSDQFIFGSSDHSSPENSPHFDSQFQEMIASEDYKDFQMDEKFNLEALKNENNQMENFELIQGGNSKKRGRPKKMAKPNESTDVSRVQMDENELIQHNSKTYEEWVSKLEKERPMTFAEEQLMKLQRRRIKNRESAHNSREKKRLASCQLSNQITLLQRENQELKKHLEFYKSENRSLTEQLSKFVGTKITTLSNPSTPIRKQITKSQKGAAAGAILFAVFFSFGIFFGGIPIHPSLSSSPLDSTSFSIQPQTSRNLFELVNLQNSSNFDQNLPPASCPSSSSPPSGLVSKIEVKKKTEKEVLAEWESKQAPSNNKTVENNILSMEYVGEYVNQSRKDLTHKAGSTAPSFQPYLNWDQMKNPPNTHHFLVSGIEQVFPPNTSENLKDEPYKMNFIVASKSLPNSNQEDERVVQILTQVIDISFLNDVASSPNEVVQHQHSSSSSSSTQVVHQESQVVKI